MTSSRRAAFWQTVARNALWFKLSYSIMSFFSIYDVLKCFTQTPRFSANYFIIGNRIFNSCTEYQNVRVNITSG